MVCPLLIRMMMHPANDFAEHYNPIRFYDSGFVSFVFTFNHKLAIKRVDFHPLDIDISIHRDYIDPISFHFSPDKEGKITVKQLNAGHGIPSDGGGEYVLDSVRFDESAQ